MSMSGEELAELASRTYGKSWKTQLAHDLEIYVSTVNRWYSGQVLITKANELAIRSLCEDKELETVETG